MTVPSRSRTFSNETAWGVLAIGLVVLAVYWPALHGGWLWDDSLEVTENVLVRDPSGWWRAWVMPSGLDYYPLKDTFFWVEWRLWHDHVEGYHLVNLALHAASAVLLWRVLVRLGMDRVASFGAATLFAVHPVAVESVAWISEFKNVLSLPFLLLAMLAWLDYQKVGRTVPGEPGRDSAATCTPRLTGDGSPYLKALACFLAAMLCKTSVVMFPVVLLLYAWWRRGRVGRRDLAETLPFFAVSIGLGLVTLWFQRHRAIGVPGQLPALGERTVQAGWSLAAYVREGVYPFRLAPVYAPVRSSLPAAIPWLGVGALLVCLWTQRVTRAWARHLLFGLGFFLINLAPVLGLMPMSYLRVAPRADHFLYLSLIGVAGLAGAGFSAALAAAKTTGARRAVQGGALVLLVGLVLTSRGYSARYRDERALWTEAVARVPEAWLARSNLGWIYLREKRARDALAQLREAARLQPRSGQVRANLGEALTLVGQPVEALAQYREAVRLDPRFAGGHFDLGAALLSGGQTAEAEAEFRTAVQLDPMYINARNEHGLALARLGRPAEAMAEYAAALRLDPRLPAAHVNLGNIYFKAGRDDEALTEYRRALQADPDYEPARQNLARLLKLLNRGGKP